MKIKTHFVTAFAAALFAVAPVASFANCSMHKSQQAGNETSAGGTSLAGAEGTGVEGKVLAGNETAVGGSKVAGGEGTGIEGPVVVGNDAPATVIKLGN